MGRPLYAYICVCRIVDVDVDVERERRERKLKRLSFLSPHRMRREAIEDRGGQSDTIFSFIFKFPKCLSNMPKRNKL